MSNLTENRLNAVIPAADITTIDTAITTITSKIPQVSLTPEQRQVAQGMNVDNKVLVEDAINELGISGAGIMPPFINATFMQNDLSVFEQLDRIEMALDNLKVKVSDAKRVAANEAVSMAQLVYKLYVAAESAGIPGAKQAVERLSERYQRSVGSAGRSTDPTP